MTSAADAMQCVEWYKCRWYIEELFRILKRKGFMIEDIQLEKTVCIEKNILFAAYSALQTITLKHAFDRPELYIDTAATKLFDTDEIETAKLISPSVNSKTAKPIQKRNAAMAVMDYRKAWCLVGLLEPVMSGLYHIQGWT